MLAVTGSRLRLGGIARLALLPTANVRASSSLRACPPSGNLVIDNDADAGVSASSASRPSRKIVALPPLLHFPLPEYPQYGESAPIPPTLSDYTAPRSRRSLQRERTRTRETVNEPDPRLAGWRHRHVDPDRSAPTQSSSIDYHAYVRHISQLLEQGQGTTPALVTAHKFLYQLRRASGWKRVYAAQFPDADMDAHLLASRRREPHAQHIVEGHESHPYVQACGALVRAFLGHPFGAAPARSLLKRQMAEGVPLIPRSARRVLHHLPVSLKDVGVLLPTPTPPVMLAATISAAVKVGMRETPEKYREIIAATLNEGGERTEPETWDWRLWAALVSSHVGDYRGAVRTLGEFKAIVVAARNEAIERGRPWPDARAPAVGDAYTNVMHLWLESRATGLRSRGNPDAPGFLAADLESLLAPAPTSDSAAATDRSTKPPRILPLPFLTAWLNAERLLSSDRPAIVWAHLAGRTLGETVAGAKALHMVNAPSYAALLRVLEARPPQSYRALAPNLPFTVHDNLLQAVAHHPTPDLPLARALLDSPPGELQSRRLDLAVTALVRAAREFRRLRADGKNLLPPKYPPLPRSNDRPTLSAAEWEWAAQCLGEPVLLPLSAPQAVLEGDTLASPSTPIVLQTATFCPKQPTQGDRLMSNMKRLLDDAIVHEAITNGETGKRSSILSRAMAPIKLYKPRKASLIQ